MLPKEKSNPQFDFSREKILLYGDPKIGKTSLVAAIPEEVARILFIATEDGHSKVSAYVHRVKSWTEFDRVIKELETGIPQFNMVCVDTIEGLWYLYLEDFLKTHGAAHEGDVGGGYGKGYAMLTRGFVQAFFGLQRINAGWIFISHARLTPIEQEQGHRDFYEATLPVDKNHQIRDSINGLCDYILFFTTGTTTENGVTTSNCRMLRTNGTREYIAGARWPLIDPIPLINDDAGKSATRLVNAYRQSARVLLGRIAAHAGASKPAPAEQTAPTPATDTKPTGKSELGAGEATKSNEKGK